MSQLTTNTVQLGQDQTTDANNFVLTAPGDGSFRISSGIPGNTGDPVFEVTSEGTVLVANQNPVEVATSTAILYSIVLGG